MSPNTDAAGLLERMEALLPAIQARAARVDLAAAFPAEDVDALRAAGVLNAPVPRRQGGLGVGTAADAAPAALALMQMLGRGNLALGRLVEAHINALRLVFRYADATVQRVVAEDVAQGCMFGLWVTDPPDRGLRLLADGTLLGEKRYCSGAGHVTRAVVTAVDAAGGIRLVVVAAGDGTASPLPGGPAGMRGAVTGQIRFDRAIGRPFGLPGDYLREPDFSCGAWRTSAVTLGGIEALADAMRRQLRDRGRAADPHQQARFGQVLIAAETARLWMVAAAARAEAAQPDAGAIAYVGLARLAVERAALDVIELVQRSLGLAAMMQGTAVERICRDLGTYLRQPAPDMVLTEAAAEALAA